MNAALAIVRIFQRARQCEARKKARQVKTGLDQLPELRQAFDWANFLTLDGQQLPKFKILIKTYCNFTPIIPNPNYQIIAPLGIIRSGNHVLGGVPDIGPMASQGVPTINQMQNGLDYFDLHHTPDDTLDKIAPQQLAQNVAAFVVFAYLAAEMDVQFRK